MKDITFFTPFLLFLYLLCILFTTETEAGSRNGDGVYIVYMGSASSASNANRAQILINTMFKRLYTTEHLYLLHTQSFVFVDSETFYGLFL